MEEVTWEEVPRYLEELEDHVEEMKGSVTKRITRVLRHDGHGHEEIGGDLGQC